MAAELTVRADDGVALAVSVHPGSGTPLLLIPGLGATRVVFDPLIEPLLARGLRPAVMDNRGVGRSGWSPGPHPMEQLAADAAAVIGALSARPAHVLGASMGGMIAQHVALEHPARVDRLVLACTGPGGSHAVKADPEDTARLLGRGARSPEAAYRMATAVLYDPAYAAAHPDLIEAQIHDRARHPVPAAVFQAQRAASWEHDTWERLPQISAPTLVLHGTHDLVMPVGNGRILAERIPGARLVEFEGAGHLLFHEMPERFAEAVASFLSGRL
ncbi:MAG TPA: alpha/beta fold hydrolase [Candidatus Dormibacteraeota bacterium]